MVEVRKTAVFQAWYERLRDVRAKASIDARIDRLSLEHFGDAKAIGEGVSELRLAYGSGYRLYFVRRGQSIVVLLCDGDKGTQRRDIARARQMAREI